jgi:2-haloacid dehalogenase
VTRPLADVRALLFDVFGTVVNWRDGVAREVGQRLGARGVRVEGHAFADRWRARYQPAMEEVRSGRRPFARLDDLHRENLVAVLGEFGVPALPADEVDALTRAWHRLDPWPDAVEGLTRLKRRYILATCSNGNIALMVNLARHAGLPWDAILGAEPARAYKPQPEVYLRTADFLGLAPGACAMVAAHADDLRHARVCGLRTAYVDRPAEYGPVRPSPPPAETEVDVFTRSFTELADRLGC